MRKVRQPQTKALYDRMPDTGVMYDNTNMTPDEFRSGRRCCTRTIRADSHMRNGEQRVLSCPLKYSRACTGHARGCRVEDLSDVAKSAVTRRWLNLATFNRTATDKPA
jgi:hypothetical protein